MSCLSASVLLQKGPGFLGRLLEDVRVWWAQHHHQLAHLAVAFAGGSLFVRDSAFDHELARDDRRTHASDDQQHADRHEQAIDQQPDHEADNVVMQIGEGRSMVELAARPPFKVALRNLMFDQMHQREFSHARLREPLLQTHENSPLTAFAVRQRD